MRNFFLWYAILLSISLFFGSVMFVSWVGAILSNIEASR